MRTAHYADGYGTCKVRISARAVFVLGSALLCLAPALAQEYIISTLAGGAPLLTPSLGISVSIFPPAGMAVDSQGTIFFTSNHCIYKLDRDGTLTRVAGTARPGYSGDGGPALAAQLNNPASLVVDRSGNIYFVDIWNYRIRRISPEGVITTFAGTGGVFARNPPVERSPAPATPLRYVAALAADGAGDLYYIDEYANECRIRRISRSGLITTVAGGGDAAPDDGSVATTVLLHNLSGIVVDDSGNLFLSVNRIDESRVLKVDAHGVISTVAGTGPVGSSGDGGPAISARLNGPGALSIDEAGNLFIADRANFRVRKVSPDGNISTVAGGGKAFPGDRTQATEVNFCSDDRSLSALSNDHDGNLYIAACWIQKVNAGGMLSILAGNGIYNFGGDGGPASSAQLFGPTGLARDRLANLYIADSGNNRVRKVTPDGIIQTIAGNGKDGFGGDGGPAAEATLNVPWSVVADSEGALYISDSFNCRIRKVSTDGRITTIAGTGNRGFSADGTAARQANICPGALTLDNEGNLLFADGSWIRKIDGKGIITTVAGNGKPGFSGDGGPATEASFYAAWSLTVDKNSNLLFTDTVNNRIRKVSPDGIISTIAGVSAGSFYTILGDGGPATEAVVFSPTGVAADNDGNIFISEEGGLRKITPDGIINTIARSTNPRQSTGDGGAASRAHLRTGAITIGDYGRLYVVDHGFGIGGTQRTADASIRILDATNETIILSAVRDAATQAAAPISPGKIVVLYGVGMGPEQMLQNLPIPGIYTKELGGTEVLVNGVSAPILYTSSYQVSAMVPESTTGSVAQVSVKYQGRISLPLSIPVSPSSPGIFSANGTGAGQAAALNPDGSYNDAAHPCRPGEALTLFITGEGRTSAAEQALSATIGGLYARVQRVVNSPNQTPGVLQVVVEIPPVTEPGGYVPVAVQIGGVSSPIGASWIAIAAPNPLAPAMR